MKSKKSFDKLRGGYYTPQAITEFICKWIINKNTKNILEPSCGDGNFLKAIVERIENLKKARKTVYFFIVLRVFS